MNDDFLYRLRTEPPEHFATQLKERLDRGAQRKARLLSFGVCVLLFGTAFAVVSPQVRMSVAEVISWIRGGPEQTAEAPVRTQPAPAAAPREQKAEKSLVSTDLDRPPTNPDELVKAEIGAILDAERARRAQAAGLPNIGSAQNDSGNTDTSGADDGAAQADAGGAGAASSQTEFIVTGPLLGEVGTAAYSFETRRAYFTVMDWYTQQLNVMRDQRAPVNARTARTVSYRLAVLVMMMPDVFAKNFPDPDPRVPTRSKPTVWTEKSRFMLQSLRLAAAVKMLMSEAGSASDARLREMIQQIDTSCTNCHEKFREDGDHNVGAVNP